MIHQKIAATRAEVSLDLYIESGVSDEESALRDLLTDLRHYCDREGLDFAAEDRQAYQGYVMEKSL